MSTFNSTSEPWLVDISSNSIVTTDGTWNPNSGSYQWHWRDGTTLPFVGGGAGEGEGEGEAGEGESEGSESAASGESEPEVTTFTQDEVTKIATREARAAERKANQAIADALGMSVDDAKAFIDQKKEADEAAMTEAEKAQAKAQSTMAEANKIQREAQRTLLNARVSGALAAEGLSGSTLERAVGMVMVDLDADDETITEEIEAIKKDMPSLFAAPRPPASTPQSPRGRRIPENRGQMSDGAERYKTEHPNPAA